MAELLKKIYIAGSKVSNNNIQALWMGEDLSLLEQLSIKSYLYHDHRVILYVYDNIGNIPDGVDVRDAAEILPIENIERYSEYRNKKGYAKTGDYRIVEMNTYSLYSDLFRYHLLLKHGGWWSDLDMVCLKPYDFDSPYVLCRAGDNAWVCGSVMKCAPNSFFMEKCLQEAIERCKNEKYVDKTGPALLESMVIKYRLELFVVSYKIFFPVWWLNPGDFLTDIQLPEESYGVHMCNTQFSSRFDKNESFSSECLFEKMKRKYL